MPTVCRTLLTDGQTRCSVVVKQGRQSCPKHGSAYDASYERYKHAENAAKDLRIAAQTKRGDSIEPRIESVRTYIKALELELKLRKEHDARFIGDPDEGHRKRLDALEKQLAHHRDIVEALRARLQHLAPVAQPSPSKPRSRRRRHTLTHPTTPQPPPSVTRKPRRQSDARPKLSRGAHRKSRSELSGSKKQDEDPIVSIGHGKQVIKEEDGFGDIQIVEPSRPSIKESAGAWGDRIRRGLQVGCPGGGEAERGDEKGCRAESIGLTGVGWEDIAIPSDGASVVHPAMEVVNTGATPSPVEVDTSSWKPTNDEDASPDLQVEDEDTLGGRSIPSSPLPKSIGECPEADPESQEADSGGEPRTSPQGRYLRYALTAILPATVIVLNRMLATIRDRASKT